MSTILPINLDDLLRCGGVESERVEFKASWDPQRTGPQALRTICAFANDYHNLNGGYVVIGVGEQDGRAALPPSGLSATDLEAAQQWIRGNCNRLDPPYQPILSPETVDDLIILVVWAPASETRPHRAPAGDRPSRFWVRLGAETVDAEQRGGVLPGLVQQTDRVPWDDRRAQDAQVEDLREAKVREHLRDIRSGLLDQPNERDIYRRMRLTVRVNDHEVPRNAGLLFFSKEPTQWFRGARIEVVQFAADRAGNVQEERTFDGGLVDQLRDCLNCLENLSTFHLQKQRDRSQVRGWVSYPLPALRETLVNAVYHRGYDVDQPEPTKVWLYPGRIEVVSYPGPVPGIESRHLVPDAQVPPAPARNRRIGEFLKELGLAEGRLSGLPKVFHAMEANGSPVPRFAFDEQRTWFQATLPAHPEYGALSALRDAAHLRALGESAEQPVVKPRVAPRAARRPPDKARRGRILGIFDRGATQSGGMHRRSNAAGTFATGWEALRRIESAWVSNQASAILASEMIRAYATNGETGQAESVLETFEAQGAENAVPHVVNTLIEALMEAARNVRRCGCSSALRHWCSAKTPSTRPSWLAASGTLLSRIGTSNARGTESSPIPVRCTSSPRPRYGWPPKPTARGAATRTGGFSRRHDRCWSEWSSSMHHPPVMPGRGGTSPAPSTGCERRFEKSRTLIARPSNGCRTNGGSSRSLRGYERLGSERRGTETAG